MEESFPTLVLVNPQQRDGGQPKAKTKGVPDDLTNLNWVAGIPVPINTSVSPPEGARTKRLYFGSPSAAGQQQETGSPSTPTFAVPARTKSLKTPLPTYKIVVKDQTRESSCYSPSSNNPSPEKRDSVILANIVSSGNGYHESSTLEPEKIIIEDDECCIDYEKTSGGTTTAQVCAQGNRNLHLEKPNCSYTCLIGMALKASSGCLPVNAIYQYIEREFPYFITAPDGWKNSVRHNLSLNPIFRKVNREGWTGKKGYLWKVSPDKQDLVDKEILRFLHSTGKKLGEFTPPPKVPSATKYKQRTKKIGRPPPIAATPILCSRCTRIVSPTPQESSTSSDDSYTVPNDEIKKFSAEVQEEVTSSDVHLKTGPSSTQSVFDTDKSPSKYIGMKSPPQDPKDVAKEMFGLYPSPDNPNGFYSPLNYGGPCGPFIPFFAQPGQFGLPYEGIDQNVMANSSSSSSDASPMGAHMFPHYPQYAVPMPFPYMLGSQYPQMYGCGPYDAATGEKDGTGAQNLIAVPPPMSVKVLSSSDPVDLSGGQGATEADDACERKNPKGKRYNSGDFSSMYTDVSSLSSPLKRMKVAENSILSERADDSISAYFADISANSTCSDEDAEENEEVSSIMSLLMKSKQSENTDNLLPLAEFNHMSSREKQDLEQIAGVSDLDSLLNKGLESLAAKEMQRLDTAGNLQSPPPPICETKYMYNEDCGGMTTMDMHDISAKVTSSQEENYYLPSLDSLLNMGEDTIVTMKTAMNLDIQGVVEIATEDGNTAHPSTTKPGEIQIN